MRRREMMAGAATTAIVATIPAIGREGFALPRSQVFSGAGWYAFSAESDRATVKYVLWVVEDDGTGNGRLALSMGPDAPILWRIEPEQLDAGCIGKFMTADEADKRAGTGRYAAT